MKRLTSAVLSVGVFAHLASACAPPPRILTAYDVVGERTVKQIVQESAADDGIYDYILRVCNIDGSAQESQCVDTTVLTNVNGASF